MKIGSNIRKLRTLRGYSQEYMASKLGMSQNNYHKIEVNEIDITVSRVDKLCKVLQVDSSTLLNFDDKYIFNNTFNNNSENNAGANMIMHDYDFEAERKLYERLLVAKDEELRTKNELILLLKSKVV
jgi:transcriptional regulator with XRE-family HTH domain